MVSMLFPPDFGGSVVQSIRLANALIAKGVNVEFLADNGNKPTVINESYQDIQVTRLKTYSDNKTSKFRELIFCLKMLFFIISRPDLKIIHFHSIRGLEALFFPIFYILGRKVMLKLTLVDSDDPLTFKKRKNLSHMYMWGLNKVHAMVAISEELKKRALLAGINNEVVKKIYNGFDTTSFFIPEQTYKDQLKVKLGINSDGPIFLSIGKVEYRKGYDLLIESFSLIQKEIPSSQLLIVGPDNDCENPFYVELQRKIEVLELNNIFFLGKKDNAHEYIKASDSFLFCSRQEGFGTVLIEAMACGLPTVAMNIEGNTEEIVTDKRLGVICFSREPEGFAEITLQLMKNRNNKDIRTAAETLKMKFSIDAIANQYIELYKSISKN